MTEKGVLLFPKINLEQAVKRYSGLNKAFHEEGSFEALKNLSNPEMISKAAFTPTGGDRVDVRKLLEIREVVRETAENFGYPETVAKTPAGAAFDRRIGTKLFEIMGIIPGEAAREGVWAFLTSYIVPEIAPWRWGTWTNPDGKERFVHPNRVALDTRNTLMKCWWSAWSIGPDLDYVPNGVKPIGEDERTAIVERTSLLNQRTTRAMRDTIWRAELTGFKISRSELTRRFGLRVLAENTTVMFDVLDNSELRELFDQIMKEALKDLSPEEAEIEINRIDMGSITFSFDEI